MLGTVEQTPGYHDHRVAEQPKRFQVEKLWQRHKVICQLAAVGMKQVEIAEQLGISPVTVSYTLRSPLVRHQVELLQAGRDEAAMNLLEQISDMAPKAVALLDVAMDDETQPMPTRLHASRELRGWMEFVLPKKRENVSIGALLSLDDIKEIKAEALKAGAVLSAGELTSKVERAQYEVVA